VNSLCVLLIGSSLYLILTRYRQTPKLYTAKLKYFTAESKQFTTMVQAFYSNQAQAFYIFLDLSKLFYLDISISRMLHRSITYGVI